MAERKVNAAPVAKLVLVLSIVLLVLFVTAKYPAFIERYYSEGVFPYLVVLLRGLFNFIPFSVGDIAYLIFIIWTGYGLIQLIRQVAKRQFRAVGLHLLKGIVVLQVMLIMFYAFWGLNYSRQPAVRLFHLQDTTYTLAQVKTLSNRIVDSLNSCRSKVTDEDLQSSNAAIISVSELAVNHLARFNPIMAGWHPHVKRSLFTPLLNYMGTSGYNNPFTGEAQLNSQMPVFDRPVTACHEMAHQLGFAREDEANFVGFISGSRSDDRLLKYSAYYLATEELLLYLRRRDSAGHKQLVSRLSKPVREDFRRDSLYWTHYEGAIDQITGSFYNEFLKANKQPAGLRTYNRMIVLLLAWYRQRQPIADDKLGAKSYLKIKK